MLTLDVYLVQMLVINFIMPKIIFPLNIIVCLICIIISASVIHLLSKCIGEKLNSLLDTYGKK